MKIFYFTPFYPPQGEAAATRAYWFVKVLKEADHDVRIVNASGFSLRPASNKDRALTRLLRENVSGIILLFKIITSRNDVIVLSSPPFFTVLWGAFGAVISGQKYILDIRDLYPEVFFELRMIKKNSPFGWVAKKLTKLMYGKSHAIMTVTQGLCREIESYGEKKSHLVMNGYDPEIFFPGNSNEKFGKFTLVFHGTLGKLQNIETLLKLAQTLEMDDLDILVAGDGPKVQDIINAGRPNIKYLGNIPYSEIPSLLRKCHVGLSFRTDDKIGKEAFPVKVFEYLGIGLPVIMAPQGEAGKIVEELGFGKEFDNRDIEEMAAHIRQIKVKNITGTGKVEAYSRESQAAKILDLL